MAANKLLLSQNDWQLWQVEEKLFRVKHTFLNEVMIINDDGEYDTIYENVTEEWEFDNYSDARNKYQG